MPRGASACLLFSGHVGCCPAHVLMTQRAEVSPKTRILSPCVCVLYLVNSCAGQNVIGKNLHFEGEVDQDLN
jgi:hypothetical protein